MLARTEGKLLRSAQCLRALPTLFVCIGVVACGGGGGEDSSAGPDTGGATGGAPPSGVAELSWTPPVENTDGSVLNNLAGYRVFYGRTPDNLGQEVGIENPSVSRYTLENLSGGVWYFAVVAVNSDGVSSAWSDLATKNVQ